MTDQHENGCTHVLKPKDPPDLLLSLCHNAPVSTQTSRPKPSKGKLADASALMPAAGMRHLILDLVSFRLDFVTSGEAQALNKVVRRRPDSITAAISPDVSPLLNCSSARHDLEIAESSDGDLMPIDRSARSSFSDLFDKKLSMSLRDSFQDELNSQSILSTMEAVESKRLPTGSCLDSFPSSRALVDAVFRLSITDKPGRIGASVTVNDVEPLTRLADFAPSVFTPGYAQAMADNASYFEVIAGAVTSGLLVAEAPDLRQKKSELLERGRRTNTHAVRVDDKSLVREAVKASTWRAFAYCLRDPGSSRRLKPLERTASDLYESNGNDNFEAMLNEDLAHAQPDNGDYDLAVRSEDFCEDVLDFDEDESDPESCLFEDEVCLSPLSHLSDQDMLSFEESQFRPQPQLQMLRRLTDSFHGLRCANSHSPRIKDTPSKQHLITPRSSDLIKHPRESIDTLSKGTTTNHSFSRTSITDPESDIEMLDSTIHINSNTKAPSPSPSPAKIRTFMSLESRKSELPLDCSPNSPDSSILDPAINAAMNDHFPPLSLAQPSQSFDTNQITTPHLTPIPTSHSLFFEAEQQEDPSDLLAPASSSSFFFSSSNNATNRDLDLLHAEVYGSLPAGARAGAGARRSFFTTDRTSDTDGEKGDRHDTMTMLMLDDDDDGSADPDPDPAVGCGSRATFRDGVRNEEGEMTAAAAAEEEDEDEEEEEGLLLLLNENQNVDDSREQWRCRDRDRDAGIQVQARVRVGVGGYDANEKVTAGGGHGECESEMDMDVDMDADMLL